ncbi:MAG TPA: branched-chain amino acid ABC transporter permease [Sporichthyaceae bacterium]|nr:branched-chain amino acid ABC transporter permease [Sporichthyaceae bacterium]
MHLGQFREALVAGIALGGLYGLLPISIVLSYRISRTIAFVHAGIAAIAALTYWLLAVNNPLLPKEVIVWSDGTSFGTRPQIDPILALLIVCFAGLLAGGAYGAFVMSRRVSSASPLTLTIVSLGTMMVLLGTSGVLAVQPEVTPPSPFGSGSVRIANVNLTASKVATVLVVIVVSLLLALWLQTTHAGLCVQALADDIEAGVWCGIRLQLIGTGVYAASGLLAAFAGVLIAVTAGPNPDDMVILFLRGLALAVVGGMRSLPLALASAVLLGITETCLVVGVFGDVPGPMEELIISTMLLGGVLLVARLRRDRVFLLERQAL